MVQRVLHNSILGLLVRVFLGGVFVYASLDKVVNPEAFANIVNNYQVLPGALVNLMALILPWLELICGLCLIVGIAVRPSAAWVGLMIVMFIIAVSLALSKNININCGCFSTSDHARSLGLNLLLEDIGLLILAIHAYITDNKFLGLGSLVSQKKIPESVRG